MSSTIRKTLGTLPRRTLFILCIMALGAVLGTVGVAVATDNDRSTSDVIGAAMIVPYDGFLMLDSAPVSGTRAMYFSLYDSPSAGTAVWAEEQAAVTFYNGRFSVGLGSGTQDTAVNGGISLSDVVNDGEQLYLAISVQDTGAGCTPVAPATKCFVALSGRQAIEPVPYASWTAASADFSVGGALTVAGTTTLQGAATMNSTATVNGKLTVNSDADVNGDIAIKGADNNGTTAALEVGLSSHATSKLLLDDNEIDSTFADLTLNGNSDLDVIIGDNLVVNGRYLPNYGNWNGETGAGGAAIVNDNSSFNSFMFVGQGTSPNRRITLYDDVTVNDALGVNGNITSDGSTRFGDATTDTHTFNGSAIITGNLDVQGTISSMETTYYNNLAAATTLRSATNTICMLRGMTVSHHNENSDISACYLDIASGNWRLLYSSEGSRTNCSVACLTW